MPEIHRRKRGTLEFDPLSHAPILPNLWWQFQTAREDFPHPASNTSGDLTHF